MASTLTPDAPASTKVVKMLGAATAGLGLGALVPPDPVAVPGVGPVPAVVVAALGLASGVALYRLAPRHLDGGCGCGGDCDCA